MRRTGRNGNQEPPSAGQRRVRALGDHALVEMMRAGDDWALGEFLTRFRPILMEYARGRIPSALIPECVDEVLEDEALRLLEEDSVMPIQLRAYLIAAVRSRYVNLRRNAQRRRRWYDEAAGGGSYTSDGGEPFVRSVCAESSIAATHGTYDDPPQPSALAQLARAIEWELDAETRRLVEWVGHAVPHRTIAEWLDKSYDATTKQIWRLCRRLERAAPVHAATLPPEVQLELERFFRRVERGRRPS